MKIRLLICISILFNSICGLAQGKHKEGLIAVFNNATAMPFSGKAGFIHTPFHPGIVLGVQKHWNKSEQNILFQNVKIGYFFHRFAQQGVQLYTESGFRKQSDFGLGLEARLGLGYLHAFPHSKIFRLNSNGDYEKQSNLGRPQVMFIVAFGPSFQLAKINLPGRLFLDYQLWFQYPFVNQYIPVLPNISVHFGYAFTLKGKGSNE